MSTDDREAQIRALLPVVRAVAKRLHRMVPGADMDDLIGDGSVGLIRAVDAYDPARNIPLEQYARKVVLGAMLNGMRRLDPVSERVRRRVRNAENARFAQAQRLGYVPSLQSLAARDPALARARIDAHRAVPLSLDVALPIGERLVLDAGGDPQQVAAERAERARIRAAIDALPPRQRRIVLAHYYGERSLRSLGGPLGISPQRVSQLHLLAVKRLRVALAPERM
ncbi:MAG TPA: sigma-70 family RNA polymerase sigma factor [Candidatus Sulfotelmatobacter sp.]|nr:sigma-70 family RNA polymerase sigma factor [Candidatus Sulfotelmatobacter sp.]